MTQSRKPVLSCVLLLLVVLAPVAHSTDRLPSTNLWTRVAHTRTPIDSADRLTPIPTQGLTAAYLRTPLRFERTDASGYDETDFMARGAGYAMYLSGGGVTLVLKSPVSSVPDTIQMRLVDSRLEAAGTALEELPGRSNYLVGSDSRRWRLGVRSYGRVHYHDVYPGVDVAYYGNQQQLEYDFIVAPGATPSGIAFAIEGAQRVDVDAGGDLVLTTRAGALVHRAPHIYQEIGGIRRSIQGRYVLGSDGLVGFNVGAYDEHYSLVIDPVLSYSTYLGGANQERIHGVAVDAAGYVIVVGETYSYDFPIVYPLQTSPNGLGDAFIAKLTPNGDALVYATYLGGMQADSATAVDVDAAGAAYVVGSTFSWDFPTLGGLPPANNMQSDAFAAKLDAAGNLVYSTRLGGFLEDYGTAIAVDASGRAHIAGSTMSADFPVVNPLQSSLGGYPVHRTSDGGYSWTGLKDGLRTTWVRAFAIDPASPETVYAGTNEGVFKSTDAGTTWMQAGIDLAQWQVNALAIGGTVSATVYAGTQAGIFRSYDGGQSWTLLQLSGNVSAVVVAPGDPATLYAGVTFGYPSGVFKSTDGGDTWTDTGLNYAVLALAMSGSTLYAATDSGVFTSADGQAWVSSNAGLSSLLTGLAADPTNPSIAYAGNYDGLFKTTSGGASWDPVPTLAGVAVGTLAIAPSDPLTLYLTAQYGGTAVTNDGGETWRVAQPDVSATVIAVHPSLATIAYVGVALNRDGFLATLSADGSSLEYSTFFGGSSYEEITDIALDADGARYVVGNTGSADLPVLNGLQPAYGGVQDVFAARIGPDGSLSYATYVGGSGFESAPRVAVDAAGQAHLAGLTWSSNLPVVNAYQPQPGGGYSDAFVAVLNAAGDGFVYSTYLGGNGLDTDSGQSLGPDVAVTAGGDTYVTGTTMSLNFPTTADALQPSHAGGQNDAFLSKFDAAGGLQFSTFLGGAGNDFGRRLVIDSQGGVILAGYTSSTNFPVRNALQAASAGTDDGFITRITTDTTVSDTVAPVTTIELAGTSGLAGWYRSAVTVTLSATDGDGGSGVSRIEYRVNGGAFQVYTGPFAISAEGTTIVSARATDFAGNVETPGPSTSIAIDTVGPLVAITSPLAKDYLYTQTVTVSVSASDSTSGLAGSPALTVDGSAFTGGALDLSTLSLGPHTLVASAGDGAGNTSQSTVTFRVVSEIDTVIEVPAEAPTIQAAIDAAVNGDTVFVEPGTYVEAINFRGKAITVMSAQGPDVTVIDAHGAGSVVSFRSGEPRAAVLSGFTIRGGFNPYSGGGIYIGSSSPTIRDNVITGNHSCSGVGVYSTFGSPLIQGNKITRNSITGCTGGWGIGVYIGGNSSAEIVGNEISNNTGAAASGGGVALFAAGAAVVTGNVITGNTTSGAAGCGWGGGIISANFSQAKIVNNLVVGNSACSGGGVYWMGSTGSTVFVNNTVADNEASASWPGVYVSGFDSRNQVQNNIITAKSGPAFYCQNAASLSSPVLRANDIFSAQGPAYGGTCADQTGVDGNISADPQFVNPGAGDYRVGMSSPVVDAGNNAAPYLPPTDLAGGDRIVDGNGDGTAHVDIGALEYHNHAPSAEAGRDQSIAAGPDCLAQVTLGGSGSDPDGDALTFTWIGSFGTVPGATPTVLLPIGSHVITLTVDDGNGGHASDTVVVNVLDTVAPTITSITASPSVLQPANHEMVPVAITASAADRCDSSVRCHIVSVTSNEPVAGNGDGDTSPDWEITGDLTLKLRAERSGRGTGRIYTITVECTDSSGNATTSSVTVTVPR